MGGQPTRIHHPKDAEPPFELKGWKIRFNTYTIQGRENCAHASLAFFIGAFAAYKIMSKKRSEKTAEVQGEKFSASDEVEPLTPPRDLNDEEDENEIGCGKLE